jgi:large subunit ribosomal protein L24
VQTTLLGIGIAIILALGTALVGPYFIDWDGYRPLIESKAAEIIGARVHIAGPVQVSLLPTTSLRLEGVTIGPVGAPSVTAHKLAMELKPTALMRGEFRVDQLVLDGVTATVRLDRNGKVETPVGTLGFDPDRVGIDRVTVSHGRIVLADATSGGRVALDNVSFKGEVRSLLGPFKGDGAFAADDRPYTFRLGASHRSDDGGIRLRLAVEAQAAGVSFETDGTIWADGGAPRYEGAVTASRAAGAALPNGRTAITEPWQLTAKVKAGAATATFDEVAFVYGPEMRPARLAGSAKVEFGAQPRAIATLTARQLDLDRTFPAAGRPGTERRLPFEVGKAVAETLSFGPALPLPLKINLSVDNVTVAGASISALHGEAESRTDGWAISTFEWRAPGATLMQIAGKLAVTGGKVGFSGPVQIESSDPGGLYAWIEGQPAAARPSVGPMRGSGVLTLASERVAVDDLKAEFDHKSVSGHVAYRFAGPKGPARLDAALVAGEIDLDRFFALAQAATTSATFERPKEIALALDVGRTTYAGVEATKTHAVLDFDGTALKIERLSIADVGGAAVEASGRIDNLQAAGRGSLSLSLIAGRLDGVATVAARLMPQAAEPLRKYESRLGPLKITAKLDVEPAATGAASLAKLKLNGKVAGIDTAIDANGTGNLSDLGAATLRVAGRFDAEDGRVLAGFTGIDQLANMERRPARLTLEADGAFDRAFRVDAKFAATDVSATAAGTLRGASDGRLDVSLRAADAKLPRRAATVPVDLRSKLTLDKTGVRLDDLAGRVAGTNLKGRLVVTLGVVPRVEGRIEADQVDGAELVAILAGAPMAGAKAPWSAEPFTATALPVGTGRLEFRAGSVQWAPGLVARDLAGAVLASEGAYALDGAAGKLGDGRLELGGRLRRGSGGVSIDSRIKLVNADLAAVLAATHAPATGRISLDAEVQGHGLSAASLVGGLTGAGVVTLENVEIGGLEPAAIGAAISAVDRGLAINAGRIADIVNAGLNSGRLRLPFAAAPISIAEGRVRMTDLEAPAQSADVGATAALGLADHQVDMRFVLTGPQRKDAPGGERPSLAVTVKGALDNARRSSDVTALVNWLTARAVEQETKRLEEAERERKRLESPERMRPDAVVGPSAPEAVTATLGHAPELPPPVEIKPPPVVRRAPSSPSAMQSSPPAQPSSPPAQLSPPPLAPPLPLSDFFQPSIR